LCLLSLYEKICCLVACVNKWWNRKKSLIIIKIIFMLHDCTLLVIIYLNIS
jgi:hypothetical protein